MDGLQTTSAIRAISWNIIDRKLVHVDDFPMMLFSVPALFPANDSDLFDSMALTGLDVGIPECFPVRKIGKRIESVFLRAEAFSCTVSVRCITNLVSYILETTL